MAFFPQVVFWSTGMYKDPPILLCIALAMYAVLRLRERLSLPMIALFVVAELAVRSHVVELAQKRVRVKIDAANHRLAVALVNDAADDLGPGLNAEVFA